MKTATVNHSGTIQTKILIEDLEGLKEYSKKYEAEIVAAFERIISGEKDESDKTISLIKQMSKSREQSIVVTCTQLPQDKFANMAKALQYGSLVVNEAGGYCIWDDKCMTIVENSDIKEVRATSPSVKINKSRILIIENQTDPSQDIIEFAKSMDVNYSSILDLRHAEDGEESKLLKMAIMNGCDTIICETTATNHRQLEVFAKLFKTLPRFNFYIFTGASFKKELSDVIGFELCEELFSKHNINIK